MLEVYRPKAADEQKFVDKHVTVKYDDANGNKDDVFQGTNVKKVDRKKERHGYEAGEDEKVYESLEDFTLEEIEAYMQTEDYEQLDELSKKTLQSYAVKADSSRRGNALHSLSADKDARSYSVKQMQKRTSGIKRADKRGADINTSRKAMGVSWDNRYEEVELDEAIVQTVGDRKEYHTKMSDKHRIAMEKATDQDTKSIHTRGMNLHKKAAESGSDEMSARANEHSKSVFAGTASVPGYMKPSSPAAYRKMGSRTVKEDIEQIDELSKSTLGSYISKASKDAVRKTKNAAGEHSAGDEEFADGLKALKQGKSADTVKSHTDKGMAHRSAGYKQQAKAGSRLSGIESASKRLAKEEFEQIEEALRNVSVHGKGEGPVHAVVKRDAEWNEYQVHFYKNGKHMGEGPVSHHDDKKDAQDTAEHEVKRMNKSVNEGVMDTVKRVVKKVVDTVGHGSDEDLRKDLQKKMGLPQTGKKPSMKEEVMVEEEGSIPKTPRERELAAMHGNKKRITHGDVLKARGVSMKKEDVDQLDELKTSTIGSYIKKAANKAAMHGYMQGGVDSRHFNTPISARPDDFNKDLKTAIKRLNGIDKATARLTKEEVDQLEEAAKGHTIEAYGVKGMKSTQWRKTFKHHDHLSDWADKNDAEVYGVRELEGVKQVKTNESVELINEGDESHAQFQKYHADSAKLLKNIHAGLSKHYDNVTNKKGYGSGVAHWGHVGDIKNIHRQLQDIHDSILQQGEYAAPPVVKAMKEDVDVTLLNLYANLDEDNRASMMKMLDEGRKDELIEFASNIGAE
jgi:hypothetical protein